MASPDPVDVEAVVKKWAETMFDVTKTKDQGKIPKEHLQYNINWKRVKFDHSKVPDFTNVEKPAEPKTQVLFRTCFSNQTNQPQEYSFRTSKVTRSCCEVIVEQAYTVGYEMNVSLKTPCEIFEANAGFHKELSLTNAHGEQIEEELAWEVDSQIKVPQGRKTIAELVVTEDKYDGKFSINTEISGKVFVNVTNLRDNNSLVKVIEGNIVEILKGMKDDSTFSKGLKLFEMGKSVVKFTTRGNCNFRYAIEQHVKLHEQDIDEE